MIYSSQKGYGFKDIFRNITRPFKPILKPVLEGVKDVGVSLAGELIGDLLSGKTSKASIKERGKQARNMATQRALQTFQGGRGDFSPSSMGWSDKTAKRKRSRSKSQTLAKRKRSQSRPAKRRRDQTGGIFPPVHYPVGNYPGYNNVMTGRGFFTNLSKHFREDEMADCKDWLKRKQLGGRQRPAKKRKPRKRTQTGSGGAYALRKLVGRGKRRKQTGKKRKPRKQTGAGKKRKPTGKKSKSRKQTGGRRTGKKRKQKGAGLWTIVKDIFD